MTTNSFVMFAYLYAFALTYASCVPVQPGMAQSLTGPPNFVEPNCKSTVNFNNVSWAEGNAEMTVGSVGNTRVENTLLRPLFINLL